MLILKFTCEGRSPKIILKEKKKDKLGEITVSDIEAYYMAMVIKTV